jgi:hypothetical protein
MHVFLSYPAADRKLAERLRDELSRDGLSVSAFDARQRAGVEWRKQVEPTIRSADDILILVGPRRSPDEAQQLEWRVALQAVWQDPHKRLIPVLVRDAALPPFVYGDSAGNETKVIRLLDPRDVRGAAQEIRKALQRVSVAKPSSEEQPGGGCDPGPKGTQSYPVMGEPYGDEPPTPNSVEVGTKGSYYPAIEEARQERMLELKKVAEQLRHHGKRISRKSARALREG